MADSTKGTEGRGVLFLVASPLQALSAVEAQDYFKEYGERCNVLVIPGETKRATKQIQNCLARGKWRAVYFLPDGDRPKDLVARRRMVDALVKEHGAPSRLYLGDFRNVIGIHLARKYRPITVILDDGSALHRFTANRFAEHRASGQKARWWVPAWLKPLARRLRYGISSGPLPPVTLFTIYERLTPAPQDRLEVNRFERLRAAFKLERRDDEVFVIGGCLPELGLVDEEFYDAQIHWIAERAHGRKVSYIPHRRESSARSERYHADFGFNIVNVDVPIELLILEQGWAPGQILGFYSTALDTLHLITADCGAKIVSIKIPDSAIRSTEDISFINSVYRYFEGYSEGFEIVEAPLGEESRGGGAAD